MPALKIQTINEQEYYITLLKLIFRLAVKKLLEKEYKGKKQSQKITESINKFFARITSRDKKSIEKSIHMLELLFEALKAIIENNQEVIADSFNKMLGSLDFVMITEYENTKTGTQDQAPKQVATGNDQTIEKLVQLQIKVLAICFRHLLKPENEKSYTKFDDEFNKNLNNAKNDKNALKENREYLQELTNDTNGKKNREQLIRRIANTTQSNDDINIDTIFPTQAEGLNTEVSRLIIGLLMRSVISSFGNPPTAGRAQLPISNINALSGLDGLDPLPTIGSTVNQSDIEQILSYVVPSRQPKIAMN